MGDLWRAHTIHRANQHQVEHRNMCKKTGVCTRGAVGLVDQLQCARCCRNAAVASSAGLGTAAQDTPCMPPAAAHAGRIETLKSRQGLLKWRKRMPPLYHSAYSHVSRASIEKWVTYVADSGSTPLCRMTICLYCYRRNSDASDTCGHVEQERPHRNRTYLSQKVPYEVSSAHINSSHR